MMTEAIGGRTGDMSPALFYEVQRFKHWFFWIPIAVVTGVVWWQFYEQIVRHNPPGTQPIPDWLAWVLTIVFGLGFPAFAAVVRLITEVRPGVLRVRLAPFKGRDIPLDTIDTAMAREYAAQREFGGWGVRVSAHGRAYNAHGSKGVQLVLKDDSRILIGTQKAEELVEALRTQGVKIIL